MRKIFKSLYFRFLLSFLIIIIVTSFFSLTYNIIINFQKVKNSTKIQLEERMNSLKTFFEDENINIEQLMLLLGPEENSYYQSLQELENNLNIKIKENGLRTVENNGIIFVEGDVRRFTKIYCISKINSYYIVMEPNIRNSQLQTFSLALSHSIGSFILISICFVVIGIFIILHPIKQLSIGFNEVAKGNFDITLKSNSGTEIAQLYNNFNKMVSELKNNEYLSKDFMTNVSHEFKTPITSINGYAKLLQKDNLEPYQKKEFLNIILEETERLTKMTKNLMSISELDNKCIIKLNDFFSLDEQIRKVVVFLQTNWEIKHLNIKLKLEKINYIGNEELTYQIWMNLISNAIKYSKDYGIIEITLNQKNNIYFTIKDNGIGIDEQFHKQIFEPFFTVEKSRNNNSNGLGLTITKKLVEKINGKISFESELNVGTTFLVELKSNNR